MKKLLLYFGLIIILASCSPQRRLHRLVTKHPELTRLDTIKIQDTVIVPGLKVDTVFHSSVLKDTVFINKENLQIKLIEINDTIYLDAEVKADTVIFTKEVLVDRIVHVEPENKLLSFFKNINFFLIIIITLIILLTLLYRRLNR
jgi:hypothetical protein